MKEKIYLGYSKKYSILDKLFGWFFRLFEKGDIHINDPVEKSKEENIREITIKSLDSSKIDDKVIPNKNLDEKEYETKSPIMNMRSLKEKPLITLYSNDLSSISTSNIREALNKAKKIREDIGEYTILPYKSIVRVKLNGEISKLLNDKNKDEQISILQEIQKIANEKIIEINDSTKKQ